MRPEASQGRCSEAPSCRSTLMRQAQNARPCSLVTPSIGQHEAWQGDSARCRAGRTASPLHRPLWPPPSGSDGSEPSEAPVRRASRQPPASSGASSGGNAPHLECPAAPLRPRRAHVPLQTIPSSRQLNSRRLGSQLLTTARRCVLLMHQHQAQGASGLRQQLRRRKLHRCCHMYTAAPTASGKSAWASPM